MDVTATRCKEPSWSVQKACWTRIFETFEIVVFEMSLKFTSKQLDNKTTVFWLVGRLQTARWRLTLGSKRFELNPLASSTSVNYLSEFQHKTNGSNRTKVCKAQNRPLRSGEDPFWLSFGQGEHGVTQFGWRHGSASPLLGRLYLQPRYFQLLGFVTIVADLVTHTHTQLTSRTQTFCFLYWLCRFTLEFFSLDGHFGLCRCCVLLSVWANSQFSHAVFTEIE